MFVKNSLSVVNYILYDKDKRSSILYPDKFSNINQSKGLDHYVS